MFDRYPNVLDEVILKDMARAAMKGSGIVVDFGPDYRPAPVDPLTTSRAPLYANVIDVTGRNVDPIAPPIRELTP